MEGPGLEGAPLVSVEVPVRSLPMVGLGSPVSPRPSPFPRAHSGASAPKTGHPPAGHHPPWLRLLRPELGAGQGVEASLSCPFGLRALEPSPPSCGHHIPSLFNPSSLRALQTPITVGALLPGLPARHPSQSRRSCQEPRLSSEPRSRGQTDTLHPKQPFMKRG